MHTQSLPPAPTLYLKAMAGTPTVGCFVLPSFHSLDAMSAPGTHPLFAWILCGSFPHPYFPCVLPPTEWLTSLQKQVPPSPGHTPGLRMGSGRNDALFPFMSEGAQDGNELVKYS